jgi:EpsD family peptidyl-prolyl cis-trans isomerase
VARRATRWADEGHEGLEPMKRFENKTSRAAGAAALAMLAATFLVACAPKKDAAPGDEVVATVGGQDITASQLQIALQKQRGMRPDASDAAAKMVLDQLVDEQIVAEKAVAAKLDQDPRVVAQIEAARRDILARRFVEQVAESAPKPTDEAIRKFYDSRPAMFAQRKVFTLQRVDIQAPDDRRSEIDAKVQSVKSSDELTAWLKSQKLAFTSKPEQDASEQLPPNVLEKLNTLKDGQAMVVPSQFGVAVLTLVSSAAAPKPLADARPAIEQFLANQGKRDLVMGLQRTLHKDVKIEFKGRFAGMKPAGDELAMPAPAPTHPATAASVPAAAASQNTPASK